MAPPTWASEFKGNFCAGGAALALAYATMHPLDTFKTQVQAASTSTMAGGTGSALTLNRLFTQETGRMLSRGFVASVTGAAPQGALRFGTYELCKAHLLGLEPGQRPEEAGLTPGVLQAAGISAVSAVAGDLASSVAKVPREVITTRLQTGLYGNSATEVAQVIIKTEGPQGLFRGFASTTARDAPFMVILFVTYENFRRAHERIWSGEGKVPTAASTIFGGLSGGLAGFLTSPFDAMKTRIMTGKDKGMRAVLRTLYTEQGGSMGGVGRKLFVGAGARSVWWLCVCSIFFPTYEALKHTFAQGRRVD
ncbi:mitochondrial carrier domain-containing protein [Piptocephalis cylindrospora]|uniref:Mitochondrial carrier domain-containing protein n=1 Tax=Piptocephalis cylindrospora TaxID=1907219 RepID=A0A4P9Y3B5_9FUNG|nr:mitochondrial carrier domain-containing protein [Piptocephalis cylindrospora]|eukprot:RKP12320.1 mitochondrial carrier domain-containing protein [Piptocephalis cylindrospora]